MVNQLAPFIFLFLIGTTVINFLIAVAARANTKYEEFNQLVYYWASLFFTYLAAAFLSHSEKEIAFAFFLQFIPTFFTCKMFRDAREMSFSWIYFGSIHVVGMLISTYLILATDVGFTPSLIPVIITTSLPWFKPIWNTLVTDRHDADWLSTGMAFMFITAIIHNFNYAFFRLDESSAWWGWAISIAQYQCCSIFLNLLMNQRREKKERKNLQLVIEQLSGRPDVSNHLAIDELYRHLELQIAQREEITRELQTINMHLEEEREMNEILIKTVSHDLANPLTVINAYMEMLHTGRIPPEETDKIWIRMKSNTQSALDMISRIRNAIVTRTQANLVAIHKVSVDRSLKKVIELFETRLKEKKLSIHYNNTVPLDMFVAAEENALTEHVLTNIISNAIKFSFEGGEITIHVLDAGENIQIDIKDQGTGIKEKRLEKRLLHSTEGTKGESGTGFGLMVLGYFVRKFGGTFTIKSQTDGFARGTTVSLYLKKSDSLFLPTLSPAQNSSQYYN